jgi:hydroxyacylglutathione hydrolase
MAVIIKGGTFGPVATNTYVVASDRGGEAIIVDPAAGSETWIRATLQQLELTPIAVFNTHGHWDHIVENYVWAADGLPVWVHEGDREWLAAPAPFNPALFGNPPPTPGVTPARIVGEGDVLEVGDLRFTILETPGHSPGCVVAYEATQGHALVGDLVFAQGIGRTDFPRSDHTAMMTSLERTFREIPGEAAIYPGHGPWGVTLAAAEPYARMFM